MLTDRFVPLKFTSLGPHDRAYVTSFSPPSKIVIKETVQASTKGRNAEADALTLKINQTITQTRSNQYSKMTD